MKISFILPAYKGHHLAESIDSILSQTYKDFELIIVNDASHDKIDDIVEVYNDNRVSYYKNIENKGGKDLVVHWNDCLEYAHGEWAIMASDDDLYHPLFLQEMVKLITRYPNANVFHCNQIRIDDNGDITGFSQPARRLESAIEFGYRHILSQRINGIPAFVYRTSELKKMGGFINFPAATFSDIATTMQLSIDSDIVCSDQYLFKWRCNGENISSSKHSLMQRMFALDKSYEWCVKYNKKYNPRDYVSEWICAHFINEVRHSYVDGIKSIIQQIDYKALVQLLHTNPWPLKLVGRDFAKKNRILRIKNKILLK